MTIIDHHTKWAEVIRVENKTAETVASQWFQRWISVFGPPRRVMTDNDRPFLSSVFENMAALLSTKKLATTVYHPQGNSPIEAFHKGLGSTLRKLRQVLGEYLGIDEAVAWAMMQYRTLPHTTTGYSPAFLTTGRDFRIRPAAWSIHDNDPVVTARLAALGAIRNELVQRSIILQRLHSKDREKEEGRKPLLINQKVLVQLTEYQHRILSRALGSTKLTPYWSPPHDHLGRSEQRNGRDLPLPCYRDRDACAPESSKGIAGSRNPFVAA